MTALEPTRFEALPRCTCANLRKAARVVTQAYDSALAPVGLKTTQFSLLATLHRLGNLPLTKLAEALVMDRTTLTRNLKPVANKGWIRIDHETDQRVRIISLTDAGAAVLAEAVPLWEQTQNRIVDGLGGRRWASLIDDLERTVAVVQDT